MAHNHDGKDKQVHFVGDSRVARRNEKMVPKDYSEFPGKTEAFFPNFLLKEWMVAVVVLVGFMALVMAHEPPLGEQADPTNTGFLPVPDWYFLFLYELLKFKWASGPFVVIGTVVVPGLLFGGLLLAPWLDRGKERRPVKRPVSTGIALLSLLAIVVLTWVAWDEHEKQLASQPKGDSEDAKIVHPEDPAYEIYKNNACVNCHGQKLEGLQGPSLRGIGDAYTTEDILKIINEGKGQMPAGMFQGTEEEKRQLAEWLANQDPPEEKESQQ
ncbi:menaquinol-cytochrome c reductase cytochrome b/c subunit [Melghirimyces profundicolus]|uniref:Menaquinol-cytochrome c reductase cytochrome b/c subunit n=1 Tax=Melghirimyces profundicolus TaxID=1242148 RepID=A0A2T6BV31_9BACL|nr:menaquinol-cytochrome c reductase cytochrome b/c subunit [Melghirimyces profundicolus]PTX59924.1 menaquinol-cytochrome c reductase cytochrome b/c subunit [Melghirimyces profundicolus]